MTGYARVSGDWAGLGWIWEAKSVNGRGLELRSRLPNGFDGIDLAVREAVNKRFKRGNIALTLTITGKTAAGVVNVNEELLEQLIELARRWHAKAPELGAARLDGLLALKGVLEAPDGALLSAADDPELVAFLLARCDQLLDLLAGMRCDEGRNLHDVLAALVDQIAALGDQAMQSPAQDAERIRARLKSQVAALLDSGVPLAEDRLAQEVALLISKSDVREELDRLTAHLAAARTMLQSTEPVGRKLDFLCQEFNREANTLCSKANDIDLTRVGLAMKAAIEQFREQVQNIE